MWSQERSTRYYDLTFSLQNSYEPQDCIYLSPFKPEGYDELKEKGCEVFMPEPGFAYSADDLSSYLRMLR